MPAPRGNNRDHTPGHAQTYGAGFKRSRLMSWLGTGIAMGMCLAATACGPLRTPGTASNSAPSTATASTGPAVAPIAAGDGTVAPIEKIAPIPSSMETFKALTREEGVKLTPLFDKPAGGTDERLKRLEDAVQGMRNDFDTIMPTMVRMVSMEQSIRDLVSQLRTLTGEPDPNAMVPDEPNADMMGPQQPAAAGAQPEDAADAGKEKAGPPVDHTLPAAVAAAAAITPPANTPEADNTPQTLMSGIDKTQPAAAEPAAKPEPAALPAPEPKTAPAATSGTLQGLRIADHGAQTRIVVDMSGKAALPAALENSGRRLVIDPAGMNWAGAAQQAVRNSHLVSGYAYTDGKLVVDLRQPAKIVRQDMLAPDGGAGYRTMIDLAPGS